MNPTFDLSDPSVWDDRALIRDWDACLAEYQRYHSIHARGERVEDILDQHELEQLRKEMQEGQNRPQINQDEGDYEQDGGDTNETAGNDDEDDIAMDMSDAELAEVIQENNDAIGASHQEDPAVSGHEFSGPTPSSAVQKQEALNKKPPYPEALISSVKDESLKNLMLAWYYAGYYTGLHEGRENACQGAKTETKPSNAR